MPRRLPASATPIPVRQVTAGGLAAAVAYVGLLVVSQLDAETLQSWAATLAIGEPTSLQRVLGRDLSGAAAEMALGFGALAVALLLAPRCRWFATPGQRSRDPDWGSGSTGKPSGTEAAMAAVVISVGVLLAARRLSDPMRVDETVTVLRFATGSFWHAWSAYDEPNNHVLHTLLVWAAHQLGGWDPVVVRMPAFLAACAALPATWWVARREHGWTAAAFATSLLATSPLFLQLASNARGYSLMLLCFLVALWCGAELVRNPRRTRLWAGWAAATGLGFFAVPVMAFPAAITACWMLLLCWRERGRAALGPFAWRLAAWSGAALLLAAVLYAPALVESGRDALFANKYVQPWTEGAWGLRFWAMNTAGAWMRINLAVPLWAQPLLVAAVAAGTFARRWSRSHPLPSSGSRGLFAAAAVAGTALVLAIRPVWLQPRMTLWLVLVLAILAGAGLAAFCQAAAAPVRRSSGRSPRLGLGARSLLAWPVPAVLLVLGAGAWWGTQSRGAEWLAGPGRSANAPLLTAAVAPDLRPGDVLAADWALAQLVAFYVLASGRQLSPSTTMTMQGEHKMFMRRVEGAAPGRPERVFIFWDGDAPWTLPWSDDDLMRFLHEAGAEWCLAAEAGGGRVFRSNGWPGGLRAQTPARPLTRPTTPPRPSPR